MNRPITRFAIIMAQLMIFASAYIDAQDYLSYMSDDGESTAPNWELMNPHQGGYASMNLFDDDGSYPHLHRVSLKKVMTKAAKAVKSYKIPPNVLKPKKPSSAWIFFNNEQVLKLKKEANFDQKTAFAKSATLWKTLSDDEKKPYFD